ncbi:DUF4302 domain-containing protein [Alistipes sp. ZOR0009]|uniref:DUF4302 domain-containing protein n=1 Tax=Alistipes sp. ZOR0009 TaxID=1339253 RepID=UPI000A9D7C6D|nr:DUF4302 domain-containing protein [Alistipes sp. ZOR0009]
MKKLLYALMLMVAITSCKNDFEDSFGSTPTERKSEAISNLTKLLASSENGWKTTLIYNDQVAGAGDFFVMKFAPAEGTSTGHVTIANGFNSKTSEFSVYHATGVVLNFTSYNEVFHWLSKPYEFQGLGTGFGANVEYIFMKEENGKLYFKGKVNGSEMVLEKASAKDWDMADIKNNFVNLKATMEMNFSGIWVTKGLGATSEKPFFAKFETVYITGDLSVLPEKKGQFYRLSYDKNGKGFQSKQSSFVFTHNEILLSDPVVVGTDTLNRFVYNKDRNRWEAANQGIDGYIIGSNLPLFPSPGAFEFFVKAMEGRWYGWTFYTGDDESGKIGSYLDELGNNVKDLKYCQLNMHTKIKGEDVGCGFAIIGDSPSDGSPTRYCFIPTKLEKQGISEMKFVRNGDVISNIPNINEILTTNPYALKFLNALFTTKGWSIHMISYSSNSAALSFYNIEDPSVKMRKYFSY